MAANTGIIIGRRGVVFLVDESGRRQKCGFAVRHDGIYAFDKVSRDFVKVPEQLVLQDGTLVYLSVIEERPG